MDAIVRSLLAISVLLTSLVLLPNILADEGDKLDNLGDSLEDKLLEDLGEDFLKDLPSGKKDAKQPGPKKPDSAKPSSEGESSTESNDEENPLARIGQNMRKAEGLIAGGDSSRSTQKLQEGIVTDLDKLIEEIRKRNQQQASSSGASGSQRSKVQQPGKPKESTQRSEKPAKDSSDRVGREEVREVDMQAMQSLLKDLWGHLPERQREQMLQSSVEEFLPKYETMIRKYFLRLAEEARNTP